MINRILPILGLKNFTSDDLVKKGLEKLNPKFKNFFAESGKYGYPLGAALGFLQSEFGDSNKKPDQSLRPDEQANAEIQRQNQAPQRLAKNLGRAAIGGALGGLGGSIVSGLGSSLYQDHQQEQQKAEPQREFNPLEALKSFPELMQFIQQEKAKGGNAASISSKARKNSKLFDAVNKIERHIDEPFEEFLARILGEGPQNAQQGPSRPQQNPQGEKLDKLINIMQMLRQRGK